MVDIRIVGPRDLASCGIGCLVDRDNPGYKEKSSWLERRFEEGLRYLLCLDEQNRPLAFLEFVPGEAAWRPVLAEGWLFVHCLWVYPRGHKVGGLGSRLIEACVEEARTAGKIGVAVMVSDGPWMAGREIFLKSGFRQVAEEDRFQLLTHRLGSGPEPGFRDISRNLSRYEGLHLVYSAQCPMLYRSVTDLSRIAEEHGLKLNVTTLDTPLEAQEAPTYYGVYSLIWNGQVLADHYVSGGRFRNLLRKVILAEGSALLNGQGDPEDGTT